MTRETRQMANDPLLVVVTGSSVAMLFPSYLLNLQRSLDCDMRILMTKSAEQFVRPEALRWLGSDVFTCETPQLNPVELARKSRRIVVLPSTANFIATVALGLATSPATTAILASPAPCLFFPHMNPVMWEKPIVQRHVAALRSAGHTVIEPEAVETFEIWRGAMRLGLAMPTAEVATKHIAQWLSAGELPEATASAAAS